LNRLLLLLETSWLQNMTKSCRSLFITQANLLFLYKTAHNAGYDPKYYKDPSKKAQKKRQQEIT